MQGETLPEIPAGERLVDMWQDLGFYRLLSDGSQAPFEWQELSAFRQMSGHSISHIEASCLMDMSRAYVAGVNDTNPFSIPPMERHSDD